MQATVTFCREGLAELAKFVFDSGEPVVSQVYSAYSQPLRHFTTASALIADIESDVAGGQRFLNYALHFPDTKGYVAERKIALNPKSCDGHTWRCLVEGWGLIYLQADLKHAPAIECRVAANSQKRAEAFAATYPDFRDPGLWDWRAVQRHAGSIIRRLKKIAEQRCEVGSAPSQRAEEFERVGRGAMLTSWLDEAAAAGLRRYR